VNSGDCKHRRNNIHTRLNSVRETALHGVWQALLVWIRRVQCEELRSHRPIEYPLETASRYELRPVFKSSMSENWSRPWEMRAFKGHVQASMSNASGIQDPQGETVRIETSRSNRRSGAEGWRRHSRRARRDRWREPAVHVSEASSP